MGRGVPNLFSVIVLLKIAFLLLFLKPLYFLYMWSVKYASA